MGKDKGVYTGIIGRDEKNNYFCGPYLLDYKYTEANKFSVGDTVSLKSVVANPSHASNEKYPMKSGHFFLANKKSGGD
jgi:hypothetical protein